MGLQTAKTSTIFAVLCILQTISLAQSLEFFDEPYGNPFNESVDSNIIDVLGNGTINLGAIQITPDSGSSMIKLTNESGRAFLKRSPFKIWEESNSSTGARVASFNSSFLINIGRLNNATPGEGLTFLIASDKGLPSNSFGEYLGLTNSTTDGNSSNKFVAIEFDTYKQDFDLDDNHVGLDINSVISINSESLTPYGIVLSPLGVKFFNVWVIYDGVNKTIEVYMLEVEQVSPEEAVGPTPGPTPPRPSVPVLRSDLDLSEHVEQYSYFGFSASTGNFSELNCILRWNLTVEILPEKKNPWVKIVIGVCVPVLVLLLMGGAWLGYNWWKKRMGRSRSAIKGALKSLPGSAKEYDFGDLKKATNNFDKKNKLGQGGYGAVYYGMLTKENIEIAVKCLLRESMKGQDEFLAELTIINRLRHRHLVRLLGWCYKYGKLLLVYEYMPKGSLDQHLFAGPEKEPLGWNLRYKIVSGVASALHYLHNEYDQRVVHRDLKASNIMLNSDFTSRLGDFGLARVLDHEKTSYIEVEGVPGTIGYIAPECFHTGKATQQSDVYAFGAVLLEVVCGLRPGSKISNFNVLVDWVWYLHRDSRVLEAVDPRLGVDYIAEEAERLLILGLACSHPAADQRPKTEAIVQILNGSVSVPYVPPFKPAFIWPATGSIDIDLSTADTTSLTYRFNSEWSKQTTSTDSNTLSIEHYMV